MKQVKSFSVQDPDANVTHVVVFKSDYDKLLSEYVKLKMELDKPIDLNCLYRASQELIEGAKKFQSQLQSYEKVSRERITADEMNDSKRMVDEILAIAGSTKNFDPTFVISVRDSINSGKILTYGQYGVLGRTHYYFTKKKKSKEKSNARKPKQTT